MSDRGLGSVKTGCVVVGRAVMVWSPLSRDVAGDVAGLCCGRLRLNSTDVLGNTRSEFKGWLICELEVGLTKTTGSDENPAEEGDGGEDIECVDDKA